MAKKIIKFHKEYGQYGEFSNYHAVSFKAAVPSELTPEGEPTANAKMLTPELDWTSSEHLFQAMKFSKKDSIGQILACQSQPTAEAARKFPQGKTIRSDWHAGSPPYKVRAMRYVVRKKFSQNPNLKQILLSTGDNLLIEDTQIARSYNDDFWGNGWSGTGQKWLGRILAEIRTELSENLRTPLPTSPPVPIPIPTSSLSSINPNPVPTPAKASENYREGAIQELVKQFHKYDFGTNVDKIMAQMPGFKQRIKGVDFDSEAKIEDFVKKVAGIFDQLGKKKLTSLSPDDNLPTDSPIPSSSQPTKENVPIGSISINNREKSSESNDKLNQLKDLNKPIAELEKSGQLSEVENKNNQVPEFAVIKQYFLDHNINKITLKDDGGLEIEYQKNGQDKKVVNFTTDDGLKGIHNYLRQQKESFLSWEKLSIAESAKLTSPEINYWPWILGAGVLVLLIFYTLIIVHRQTIVSIKIRKNFKK